MLKQFSFAIASVLFFCAAVFAQNSNSSTTKMRPPAANANQTSQTKSANVNQPATAQKPAATQPKKTTEPSASEAVLAAFNKILDGIQKANVDLVTSAYWNNPSLVLFNYNGTVTKGWQQMRKNRESSYPDIKDVKLDVTDKHIIMLGRDGAVATCLWTQSQTYKGAPDAASGRMTLVFKRVGTEWKAAHLHTSPDKPDASRVPASEQMPSPSPSAKP